MKNEKISILIPIYNFDVTSLVDKLLQQANIISSQFEILLIDDKSNQTFIEINDKLARHKNVIFLSLEKNIGRSKIRNLLFEKASFEKCIIMDCDVDILNDDFLLLYLNKIESNNVVVGGHQYAKNKPKDPAKYFHWLYGSKVEVQPVNMRIKNPYASFMTNCFAIQKNLFNSLKFNQNISEYGHEDTLFGFALKKNNVSIIHIDNPVLHMGIDDEKLFYSKQEKALKNLASLYQQKEYKKDLQELKLIKFYNSMYNIPRIMVIMEKLIFFKTEKLRLLKFSLWKIIQFNKYMKIENE